MYGIVNKAVEDLVIKTGGVELWDKVRHEAGIDTLTFVAQEVYPDEITYKLVGAVSAVTGNDAKDILKAFGHHWSQYTGAQGYGDMFKMLGNDLQTFLKNLPVLHDNVALIFPEIVMPRFQTEVLENGSVRVLYRSEREGLSPMVFGLLQGMATVYETKAVVTHVRSKSDEFDAEEFLVEIVAQS